jgi:FhuF-like iron-sulfur protein/ferric iron reductase FhuF-like transporter
VTDARGASGLDDLAALGPFFAVRSHLPGAAPPAPWRPGSELAGPSEALAARIDAVRAALTRTALASTGLAARDGEGGRGAGEVEPRVAGSVAHLGLTARLIAPALGAAVLRCPLDLRPAGLWWQDELGGAMPLSVPAPAGTQRDAAAVEHAGPERGGTADGGARQVRRDQGWERLLLDETIAPLTAAVARLVTVSWRVLWGNVASAVNTAAAQVARQRPDLAPQAWLAAGRLLADPRLRTEPCPPGPRFRRSSCCLFYRLTPGEPAAICGDCVLGAR